MPERVQQINEARATDGSTTRATKIVETDHDDTYSNAPAHQATTLTNVVWYITGILMALLAFRFVLALLGANPSNSFANFIYSASHPFVAPFFGLFSYDLRYGVSRFEAFTLVAMAVYALVALAIVRLININRPVAHKA